MNQEYNNYSNDSEEVTSTSHFCREQNIPSEERYITKNKQSVWPPIHYSNAIPVRSQPAMKTNPNALNGVKHSYSGEVQAYNAKAIKMRSQVVMTSKYNDNKDGNNGLQIIKGVKDMELEENTILEEDEKSQ
ncbi:unnamed protein product [Gordionus sp. m RMFG-2023]